MQKMFILARGFALIATVSVLLLMTVIAVAFMSISAVTVRTSRIDWAQEEARANARLGLMVAIGELQRDLGPDQRIAITGAIMDSQPDTSTIEGVQNPHWTGFVSSIFEGNQNGSPFTRDMDQGGLEDARNGTNYRIRPLVRNYFVSGNEGGPERMAGGRRFLDAVTEPLALSEDTVEIVSLGSTIRPEDRVRVVKTNLSRPRFTQEGGSQLRQSGAYSYWVTPNNQKAHLPPDIHRGMGIDHNNGDGMQRMLHPQDHDPFVMTGIQRAGQNIRDERILTPRSLMLLDANNRRGVLENFHALTPYSYSTLTNVRDGGLKKNLSAFLYGGGGGSTSHFSGS